ncbi:MAG: hypothetical protein WCJ72_06780 [Chryseobacterium sp.]
MKEIIQKLASTGDEIYAKICEVTSVDQDNKTADLKPLDGSSEIFDAYLVTDDENGSLYLEPKAGSLVCVVFVTKEIAVMVSPSELVRMRLKIEGVELEIDKDGFLLKKENETLKKLMGDFIKACRNMVFQTNAGITIELLTDPEFEALETRFNQFLK